MRTAAGPAWATVKVPLLLKVKTVNAPLVVITAPELAALLALAKDAEVLIVPLVPSTDPKGLVAVTVTL